MLFWSGKSQAILKSDACGNHVKGKYTNKGYVSVVTVLYKGVGEVCTTQVAHQAGAYPGFCSME